MAEMTGAGSSKAPPEGPRGQLQKSITSRCPKCANKMEGLRLKKLDGTKPAELKPHHAQVAPCKRVYGPFLMQNFIKETMVVRWRIVDPENEGNLQTSKGSQAQKTVGVGAETSKMDKPPADKADEEYEKKKRRLEQRLIDLSTVVENEQMAIKQIKQIVPSKAQSWIITDLQPSNADKYPTLYAHFLKEILEQNWRPVVKPQFWGMFFNDVNTRCEDECSTYLKTVFEPALKLTNDLKKQFGSHGYFSPEKFDEMALELKVKCVEGINDPSQIFPLIEMALEKIVMVYRMANKKISEKEEQLMEPLSLQLKKFYDEEMQRSLQSQNNDSLAKANLPNVHWCLVQKLLDSGKEVLSPMTSSTVLPEKVLSWVEAMEDELNQSYFPHLEPITQRLGTKITQLMIIRYEEYKKKMKELGQCAVVMDLKELARQHVACANEQLEILDSEIKEQCSDQEPTGVFCEVLGRGILQYWSSVGQAEVLAQILGGVTLEELRKETEVQEKDEDKYSKDK